MRHLAVHTWPRGGTPSSGVSPRRRKPINSRPRVGAEQTPPPGRAQRPTGARRAGTGRAAGCVRSERSSRWVLGPPSYAGAGAHVRHGEFQQGRIPAPPAPVWNDGMETEIDGGSAGKDRNRDERRADGDGGAAGRLLLPLSLLSAHLAGDGTGTGWDGTDGSQSSRAGWV